MSSADRAAHMDLLASSLEREFRHWSWLYENGGSDPFHSDGVNLNLTRNHIISFKLQMDDLMQEESDELSLFPLTYPDIYHRETPKEVSNDYMAKADALRARAKEQLTLFEADPNFQYILEHNHEAFPHGETKAIKASGLQHGYGFRLSRFRHDIERDDLVSIRRDFYSPYEEKAGEWAAYAAKLRSFLETKHSVEDNMPAEPDNFYDEDELEYGEDPAPAALETVKRSLDDQIQSAKAQIEKQERPVKEQEAQLTLF